MALEMVFLVVFCGGLEVAHGRWLAAWSVVIGSFGHVGSFLYVVVW